MTAAAEPLAIVYRNPADLAEDPANARAHDDAQIAQIRASIEAFGFRQPLGLDESGVVRVGNGRLRAALLDPPLAEVPTITHYGLTPEQWTAYAIADNRIALNAGWDDDQLRRSLDELGAVDFGLDVIGFNEDELAALLNPPSESQADPDAVPEPPADPISRLGDIWLLGKHRIICGDSTDAATVEALLAGAQPHLMVTDPPYGVEYDADWRNHTGDLGRSARAVGKVENDDRADWREAWALFSGDVAYVWHAGTMAHIVAESLIASGLLIRAQIVWAKNQLVISRGDYHPQHEPCWYVVRKGRAGRWSGDRKQTTVWEIDKPRKSDTGHSTQKPVECMARPIRNNSKPGDLVYEPFSGSGTTIIAAEQLGRACLAIELSPPTSTSPSPAGRSSPARMRPTPKPARPSPRSPRRV